MCVRNNCRKFFCVHSQGMLYMFPLKHHVESQGKDIIVQLFPAILNASILFIVFNGQLSFVSHFLNNAFLSQSLSAWVRVSTGSFAQSINLGLSLFLKTPFVTSVFVHSSNFASCSRDNGLLMHCILLPV